MFIQTELTNSMIESAFKDKTHQADVVIALYKSVFPSWDNIKRIEGWPKISENLSNRLFKAFIEFDKKHHPDVLAGGCWMNKGFSCEKGIPDGKVIFEGEIMYTWDKNKIKLVSFDILEDKNDSFTMVRFYRRLDEYNKSFYRLTKSSYKRLMRVLANYPIDRINDTFILWKTENE